jgi:anti-anti-sigma factor
MERRVNDGLAQLETEERGDVVVARLTGEVDVSCASHMGDRIASAVPTSARALVVDFSDLEFIDSSGVAMLFGISRRLTGRRQVLHVVAPAGQPVARVLEIVEFARAAPVHGDLDSALTALA